VLSDIATAIDQAQDVAALRHRLQAPLHAAFATLGARE
jgi:hypothetical protein